MPRTSRKPAKKAKRRVARSRPEPWAAALRLSESAPPKAMLSADMSVTSAKTGDPVAIPSETLEAFLKATGLCVSGLYEQEDGTTLVDCIWGPCNCMPSLYSSVTSFDHKNEKYNMLAREATKELQSAWRRAQAKTLMTLGYGYELTVFVCNSGPQIAIRKPRVKTPAPRT